MPDIQRDVLVRCSAAVRKQEYSFCKGMQAGNTHLAVRGRLIRIDSILPAVLRPKVVPRS